MYIPHRASHSTAADTHGATEFASKVSDTTDLDSDRLPTVALLLDPRSASLVATRRAVTMANALGAEVSVLLAIPEGSAGDHPAHVLSRVANLVEALRPRHGFTVDVHHGSLAQAAAVLTRARRPTMFVVDPAVSAPTVTKLVEDLKVPVLVARYARDGEVLAATDMRSSRFPVLSLARSYAKSLGRRVSYVHNARPMPVTMSDPMAGPSTYMGMLELQNELAAAKAARLRAFAEEPAAAHLAREGSTVDAILDLARFHNADIVVVGHRARSWWTRLLAASTANTVVERSLRSVLVAPL